MFLHFSFVCFTDKNDEHQRDEGDVKDHESTKRYNWDDLMMVDVKLPASINDCGYQTPLRSSESLSSCVEEQSDWGDLSDDGWADGNEISLRKIPLVSSPDGDKTGATSDGTKWFHSYNSDRSVLLRVLQIPDSRRGHFSTNDDQVITVTQIYQLRPSTEPRLVFDYSVSHGGCWERSGIAQRLLLSAANIAQAPVPRELCVQKEYLIRFEQTRTPSHDGIMKRLAARIRYSEFGPALYGFWWRVGDSGVFGDGCFVFSNLSTGQMRILPAVNRSIAGGCACLGKALLKLCNLSTDPTFCERDTRVHPYLGQFQADQSDDLRTDHDLLHDGESYLRVSEY